MIQSETGTSDVHFEKGGVGGEQVLRVSEESKIKGLASEAETPTDGVSRQLAASDCGSSEAEAAADDCLRLGLRRHHQPLNEAGTMTTAEPPMLTKVCNKTEKVANVDLTCGFQWQYGVRRKRIL